MITPLSLVGRRLDAASTPHNEQPHRIDNRVVVRQAGHAGDRQHVHNENEDDVSEAHNSATLRACGATLPFGGTDIQVRQL